MLTEIAKFFKQIYVIYCLFIFEKIVCGTTNVFLNEKVEFPRKPVVINKCCPNESIFDFETRECIEAPAVDINKFSFIHINEYFLNCSEVMIEEEFTDLGRFIVVDDYGSILLANGTNEYCIDSDADGKNWLLRTCGNLDVCDSIPCVRKCCHHGSKYNGSSSCSEHLGSVKPTFHNLHTFKVQNVSKFGILPENKCEKYILDPDYNSDDIHLFDHKTGELILFEIQKVFKHDQYCIEMVRFGMKVGLETFVCFTNEPVSHPFEFYGIGMAISATFFAITAIVYLFIPKLMNLHGKTLVANVVSFCIAYTTLTINSFRREYYSIYFCPIYAYVIYYSLMSGFLWLNVMCADIWWSFGSVQIHRTKRQSNKRFRYYCCYACAIPFFLTAIMLGMQHGGIGGKFRPRLGEEKCWFEGLFYFIFISFN